MTTAKLIGAIICIGVINCAAKLPDISNNVWFIATSIMLAGFMAGGSKE